MQHSPTLDSRPFGPLTVLQDPETGEVVAILDRISGADAQGHYRPEYLALARERAQMAWEATAER